MPFPFFRIPNEQKCSHIYPFNCLSSLKILCQKKQALLSEVPPQLNVVE
jgi:hypothetical protein